MSEPLLTPPQPPARPVRHRLLWPAVGLGAALLVVLGTLGGYAIGKHYNPARPWDPLWLRAYLDRPIDTTAPGQGFWVTGYYVDYDTRSLDVIKTRANHMDQMVIFGYGFDAQGNVQGKDQELVKGVTGARKRVLLFGNLTDGGFNQDTAHAILTDPQVQDRAVKNLLAKADELEVAGVQIDFENLLPADRDAYTAFLKRLKRELQTRKMTLSIAAAAKTADTKSGWGGATDYPAIGQIVDQVYIMAYDEHWRGGEPGPVASLDWTERVVRYATGVMPAQKIVLGVPFYGYDWAADPKTGKTRAYGTADMLKRLADAGATSKWDPVAGENVASYKTPEGDRIAWVPDQRSLDAKLKLAYQYNLKGIALWRLGFEPDDWWSAMGAFRLHPTK